MRSSFGFDTIKNLQIDEGKQFLNTENDQFKGLIDGLNRNAQYKNDEFCFASCVAIFSVFNRAFDCRYRSMDVWEEVLVISIIFSFYAPYLLQYRHVYSSLPRTTERAITEWQ